jgi:hypothetical protein
MAFRTVLLAAAATAATALTASPALAAAPPTETLHYRLTPKVTKLTKALTVDMLLFDLSERVGMPHEEAEDARCKVKRRTASCSYRAPNPLNEDLGVDAGFCVTGGKVRLTHGGRRVAITQTATEC